MSKINRKKFISEEKDSETQALLALIKSAKEDFSYRDQSFASRQLSRFEKRVDFELLRSVYDKDAAKIDAILRNLLKGVQDQTIDYAERLLQSKLRPSDVVSFKIDVGASVARAMTEYLTQIWRKSRDAAFKELPSRIKKKAESVKGFQIGVGFEPVDALEFFQTRGLVVKGLIDGNLTNQAHNILSQHLRGGRTLVETIGDLRELFEPYVGDPTKIVPSGPGRPQAEKILEAFRLENIIRTESTTALTEGRTTMGDATGEYVIGYELSPILDSRTSAPCKQIGETEGGLLVRTDDPNLRRLLPPLHFQCRTTPVFITTDDVPVDWSTEAEINAVLELIPDGFK